MINKRQESEALSKSDLLPMPTELSIFYKDASVVQSLNFFDPCAQAKYKP